jgi:hypothetical protein
MLINVPEGMLGAHIGRRLRDTKDEANRPKVVRTARRRNRARGSSI